MENCLKCLSLVPALVTFGLVGCARPAGEASARATIPTSQMAFDMLQVQNTMSKHEYYVNAGVNLEELDAVWVKDAANAVTATFTNPMGQWVGMESIRRFYGELNLAHKKARLTAMARKNPAIKDVPENLGMGYWFAHTTTTPIIEVAGDGKTAKGIWYSPGLGFECGGEGGLWFWEKYAVDFAKENGQWKIWHISIWYDAVDPFADGPGDILKPRKVPLPAAAPAAGVQIGEKQEMHPGRPSPNAYYQPYSATRVPKIAPRIPDRITRSVRPSPTSAGSTSSKGARC